MVPWKGELEVPLVIRQKSFVKYSSQLEVAKRPVIQPYEHIYWSFSELKPTDKGHKQKLKLSSSKLQTPEKRGFSRLYFKDNHSECIRYADKAHGLFSNNIQSIIEDHNGFIWLASEVDGLVKTNGDYSWNYKVEDGLPSNSVTRLFKDSKNVLWICWDKGVSYLQHGRLFHIENAKIRDSRITRIREDKDKAIWIATEKNGLFKLVGNELEVLDKERGLSSNEIQDVAFGPSNELYVSSISGGLCLITNDKIEIIRDKEPNVYEFAPLALHLSADKLWIGSFAGSYFYLKEGKIFKVKFNPRFERSYEIVENQFGIWFADYASGVNLLRKDGLVQTFNVKNGLTDRNALSFTIDHNSNVWVADPFSGISVITVSPFRESQEIGRSVTSFVKDKKGSIWLAQNGGGLSKIDENTLENINCKVGKNIYTNDHPWDLVQKDDGSFWVGTHLLGIGELDGKDYNYYRFEKGNISLEITRGHDGVTWFSTGADGLRMSDDKRKVFRMFTKKDGLSSDYVRSTTLDDKGRLWICTDKGVNILNGNKIAVINKEKGLASDQINRVIQDRKGRFWVAHDAGVDIISGDKIKSISKKDGLIDDRVIAIFETGKGAFWVITSTGLSFLNETTPQSFRIENFGVAYGNFMLDFTGAVFEQENGKILFGTNKKTVEFDPYYYCKNKITVKFDLNSIRIDDKPVSSSLENLEIFKDQNIAVDLSVLSWSNARKGNAYFAFLDVSKKDTNWILTKLNEQVSFQFPEKGKFKFLYKVENAGQVFLYQGPVLKVKAAWYQSLWFYLLLVILAVVIVNRFVRFRLQVLNKKKKELEDIIILRTKELEKDKIELSKAYEEITSAIEEKDVIIYEMHHRVKNNLQTISTLLDMQMRSLKNDDGISALKDAVRRISAMSASHELLYSSDELSHINFKRFLTHLISTQSQIMEGQYSSSIVEYDIDDFFINVSDCISIGMIVSEIISNAAKHAFAGVEDPRIYIQAKRVGDKCEFSVADNGVGTTLDLNISGNKGLGIRLIKIFTAKLNGKIEFRNNDPGLLIKITFPCTGSALKLSDKL